MSTTREAKAITEAKALIKSRKSKDGELFSTFTLLNGAHVAIKPKFDFIASDGYKLKIRYNNTLNSIFEPEQEFTDDLKVEYIWLKHQNVIRDQVLCDFLLLHDLYKKKYKVVDVVGAAEKELEAVYEFDECWDKIRSLSEEEMQSLLLLVTDDVIETIMRMKKSQMLIILRTMATSDPSYLMDAMADPILKTLFLFSTGISLDYIKINKSSGSVVWSDSNKELCKVPVDQDAAMHCAKLLLTNEYSKSRELLDKKVNG